MRSLNRYKGKIAEEKAAQFLKQKGFKIVAKNFYCKGGEIDIIAYKDDIFHFIEVKSGKDGIYNITPKKISRLLKCINYYILKNNISTAYVLDAIIVNEEIELIENITL